MAKRTKRIGVNGLGVLSDGNSRPNAERHLDSLREEFGPFDVHERSVEVPRDALLDCTQAAQRGELGGSRVLLERDDEVLLVRYEDDPDVWDAPGGSRSSGESHVIAARRHVAEQTGLEPRITDVFRALTYEFTLVENESGVTGLWVFFVAEPFTDADVEPGDDVVEAKWFEEPPDALDEHVAAYFE